jgi:hypothetical protein
LDAKTQNRNERERWKVRDLRNEEDLLICSQRQRERERGLRRLGSKEIRVGFIHICKTLEGVGLGLGTVKRIQYG